MSDAHDEEGHRSKRFKYQSYTAQLKDVHVPSVLDQSAFEETLKDEPCLFRAALVHWTELNISPDFTSFSRKALPFSDSLPLLVHSWQAVLDLWMEYVNKSDDEALRALLDLLQKLLEDLHATLKPAYISLMDRLLMLFCRRVSPQSLAALLAALTSVFKHLLVPAVGSNEAEKDLLNKTWSMLSLRLAKCDPETKRSAAEVWSSVLRRLKIEDRHRCLFYMLSTSEADADLIAWALVSSAKSVAQSLHTCSPSLMHACFEYLLSAEQREAEAAIVPIRRFLTAMIHHCAKPAHFSAITEEMLGRLSSVADTRLDAETSRRLLLIISIPCSVRQGSRLSSKELSQIVDLSMKIDYHPIIREPLATTITAALCATTADLGVWMGAGRRAIEEAWAKDATFAATLTGTLSESGWKALGQFAVPAFIKECFGLLEQKQLVGVGAHANEPSICLLTLRVLSELARKGSLKDTDNPWRSRLANWIQAWMGDVQTSEASLLMLQEIAWLVPLLSLQGIYTCFAERAKQLVDTNMNLLVEYEDNLANSTWMFGQIIRIISGAKGQIVLDEEDAVSLLLKAISKWSWSEYVLSGLSRLMNSIQTCKVNQHPYKAAALEKLIDNLKSHSHIIRRTSLELLNLPWMRSGSSAEAVARCLTAERISLDVAGVRERVLRTSNIGKAMHENNAPSANVLATWLLGQLKVGLRPIWAPAARALKSLMEDHEEIVWDKMMNELRQIDGESSNNKVPSWSTSVKGIDDDAKETERSWRDPSGHKLRLIVARWISEHVCRNSIIKDQIPHERFDLTSYESQLLSALAEASSMAEKHNRDLVPVFLSLSSPTLSFKKPPRERMLNWLKLFAKFSNPKALHATETLQQLFLSYLAHPDRSLQSTALECLLTYRTPALLRHSNLLRLLLDDAKWRSELTGLELDKLEAAERPELIPVFIRLFFGLMLERGGRGKGAGRRVALLSALSVCSAHELTLLVDLMVESFTDKIDLDPDHDTLSTLGREQVALLPGKQQIGFLTFLGEVLKHLGVAVTGDWPRLLTLTQVLTANAQRILQAAAEVEVNEDAHEDEDELENGHDEATSVTSLRTMRTVRQLGLKRMADFFRLSTEFDFKPYLPGIFRNIISPRIPLLDRENTQAPSALLQLLDLWSSSPETVLYLTQYDEHLLPKVYDCIIASNVKPSVISRVLDMAERLLIFSEEDASLRETLVLPYIPHLLSNLTIAAQRTAGDIQRTGTDSVSYREIGLLSKLAPYITDNNQAATLLSLFLPQFRKARKGISDRTKVDMLSILGNLIPHVSEDDQTLLKIYDTLSLLLQIYRGKQVRSGVMEDLRILSTTDISISPIIELLQSLNAYSTLRLDDPDFDVRLKAYAYLNTDMWKTLSEKQWTPIIHNMLFFIRDENELSIRTNASLSMKRFLDAASETKGDGLQTCFTRIFLPGLKRGLRAKAEMIRSEVMGVLAYAVEKCNRFACLQDMTVLLAAGDDEANFFNNIFHIQVHRRIRALRRLTDYCDSPGFRNSTLQEVFIPIVKAIFDESGTIDHHLVNEAISTLRRIAKHLTWPTYYALVRQYMKLATDKSKGGRTYTRVLVAILDSFHFSLEESHVDEARPDQNDSDDEGGGPQDEDFSPLAANVKIRDTVNDRLLPTLLKHLEQRNELEDENRIPIAIGVANVAIHLSGSLRELQVSRLLIVVSQIFRSKAQSTRDLARETLCRIAVILGPVSLPSITKHLREALLRGPHLHVLAFVIHAILVHVTSPEHCRTFSKLDNCVPDAVHVSAEVIFGQSGRDIQSDTFRTNMKEAKGSSSKGMDTFAILAKFISPASSKNLLLPIKAIMQETESAKTMQAVDEVLRRMSGGIISNANFSPADILVFCHTLISQNARFFQQNVQMQMRKRKAKKPDVALVQLKRKVDVEHDHYAYNSWRFVSFGLDLFVAAFKRGRFDFHDEDVLARLEPMVNLVGNTLYASNGDVVSSGLKAVAQLVKCPLKNVAKSLPVFVRQSIEIVRSSSSTEADVSQTALKTLTIIVRDCPTSQVKEKDLVYLLELLAPDLEEPARQTTAFSLLRAIVARKFVVPEIYDLMARVEEVMVTSQVRGVQELCRGVLLQFLLDYPQGKARLQRQFAFLAKNLSYTFESGRLSVLELLSAVVAKFNDDIISEYMEMLFVALVLVIANDDAAKCRETGSQIVKALLGRLQEAQRASVLSHVHSWAAQNDNAALSRVSSQMYGIILDTLKADTKPYLPVLLRDLNTKVINVAAQLEAVLDEDDRNDDTQLDWQTPYQALAAFSKAFVIFPELASADVDESAFPWHTMPALLLYPHAWVRTAACRLLGTYFAVTPIAAPSTTLPDDCALSLKGMREVANALTIQLKSENLDETLGLQVVKNLFFVGKCFAAVIVEVDAGDAAGDKGKDNEDEDDSESESEDEIGDKDKLNANPLPWLFSKLSFQARSAHMARQNRKVKTDAWFHHISAVFRWFAAMASYLEPQQLQRYLPHVLAPLYRVSEDDTTHDTHMDELKTLAQELQDLVQAKVGVSAFASAYSAVRQRIATVRHERRAKRAVQAAADPAAAARRKTAKNAGKKESRRRKMGEFADRKTRTRFAKRR